MVVHSSVAPCLLAMRQRRVSGQRIRRSKPGRPTTCERCVALEAEHVLEYDLDEERSSWPNKPLSAAVLRALEGRTTQRVFADALFPKLLVKP